MLIVALVVLALLVVLVFVLQRFGLAKVPLVDEGGPLEWPTDVNVDVGDDLDNPAPPEGPPDEDDYSVGRGDV